ncbi:glutathione peroxidase [Vibrio genomosp. F10]|uniref:Glutathione peroxidase n=1 Tax=Vibrio genomosp. F10 TaxID=723171 RepID=A0A1B9QYL2_9VIBR|nr:glutathione peroxidase [Vibrio genomosp. F10]OCH75839.1 glutathione peroxidase [Vibrio genomosp. F10]OEF07323.1 glutathione peroxidase [Vibrio genomosp. F10 str. 9ZB36]OEF08849.1 glutathione peroxidase [Vibrio genomosp. F10 str. 9ZD137]
MSDFYQLSINTLQGTEIKMNELEGKVVLVVNTASQCGLTPQYEGLQQLHEQYSAKGLVILGCPCNQFGQQEPGSATEIEGGCLINYGVDFIISEKIEVNGDNTHPVFGYLKKQLPGLFGDRIKWNFTKFLIGKDGQPIKRFAPTTKPQALESMIRKALV